MTLRAVLFGILGGVFIASGNYLVGAVAGLSTLIGSLLPVSVFGGLVLMTLVVNPLLARIRPQWRLRSSELAVILVLTTVGAGIGGLGLLSIFTNVLALPAQMNVSNVAWQNSDVLSYVPPAMMPGNVYDERILGGYIAGLGRPGEPIGLGAVPWDAWGPPLAVWMPIILLTGVATMGLSLVVHRQWSRHERLRYPVAELAGSLLEQEPGRGWPKICRSRMFWLGLGGMLLIHTINGLYRWFPQHMIQIPLSLDFRALLNRWPEFTRAPWVSGLYAPRIWPTIVAFSFFLASDVGLTLGISHIVFAAVVHMVFLKFGLPAAEDHMLGGPTTFTRFGAYLAVAAVLMYTGRRYYGEVLKRALLFRGAQAEGYAAWGLRICLLCWAAVAGILISQGLDWPFAVLMVGMVLLILVVISRIYTESGFFYIAAMMPPMGTLLAVFGGYALGPKAMVIMGMTSVILVFFTREALMPLLVNGLQICEKAHVRPGRMARAAVITLAVALVVAVPVVLWAHYNYGTNTRDWITGIIAPGATFRATSRTIGDLKLQGQLEESTQLSWMQRLASMDPSKRFLYAAPIGFGLVLLLGALRLRFTWWPIHPILMLVWGTAWIAWTCVSYLLGWIIKSMVVRLGGGPAYRQTKLLMIGVIAGDLGCGVIFQIIGAIYWLVTGTTGPNYGVLL